jgi:hypothetical protein
VPVVVIVAQAVPLETFGLQLGTDQCACADERLWSSVTHKGLDSVRWFPDRTKTIRSSKIGA